MLFSLKQLKNLPVYAKNGQFLGKIWDIEIESESQTISKYIVRPNLAMANLLAPKLIVKPSQVVVIEKTKMIVEDTAIPDKEAEFSEQAIGS